MKLINHRICRIFKRWSRLILKTIRIRRAQVHNHAPVTIYTCCSGIKIYRLIRLVSDFDGIRVINTVQVSLLFTRPYTFLALSHGNRLGEIISVSLLIQVQ